MNIFTFIRDNLIKIICTEKTFLFIFLHLVINLSFIFQVGTVILYGVPIVSLIIDSQERLCLAQISNTLLKTFSYNEIHNRRVALGITCVQCTPVQLEILRRAGAMPVSSRRCGMITRREAERLCKSFLGDNSPPRLPEDFAFQVHHECAWGCRGSFFPSRYNSSRAKCIKCTICGLFFSPNKFIFHSHRTTPNAKYIQPDAANFNSWRRHMRLSGNPPDEVTHAWEDVKAMFNGGTRKRMLSNHATSEPCKKSPPVIKPSKDSPPPNPFPIPVVSTTTRVPPLPLVMDYVWQHNALKNNTTFGSYTTFPWFSSAAKLGFGLPSTSSTFFFPKYDAAARLYPSAFKPVYPSIPPSFKDNDQREGSNDEEETVDIETCNEEESKSVWQTHGSDQVICFLLIL